MTASVENCLRNIAEDLKIPLDNRDRDAEEIANHLLKSMQKMDNDFKAISRGLRITASRLGPFRIEMPDEWNVFVVLQMPFGITPENDLSHKGFVFLRTDQHDIVDSYVNRLKLQTRMGSLLMRVIGNRQRYICSGHTYELIYPKAAQGIAVAHTILATDINDENQQISFDFMPAFEFESSSWPFVKKMETNDRSWFAIPHKRISKRANNRRFLATTLSHVLATNGQQEPDMINVERSYRLVKALKTANELNLLTSYLLKSVYAIEIDKLPYDFWLKPLINIVVYMLGRIHACLVRRHLPFLLDRGVNVLSGLKKTEIKFCREKIQMLICKMDVYKKDAHADGDLKKFFTAPH